jgi:glutathione S-transferase
MAELLTLYSFGDDDRSGKVRWLAAELGLELLECRVAAGTHRAAAYKELNPYAQIPTVEWRGRTVTESTAICHTLAEAFTTPKLWIGPGGQGRAEYLHWLALFGETLEARLVECMVSKLGILGPEYFALHEKQLRFKLGVAAKRLPAEGHLAGERFTVADIVAGYNLRLAIQCGLVERAALEPYFDRLVARPAAEQSRIFASLK